MFPRSIEDLQQKNPYFLPNLFKKFDLNIQAFAEIKEYVNKKEYNIAARLLLDYYKKIRLEEKEIIDSDEFIHEFPKDVDKFLNDIYCYQGVEQKQRGLSSGLIDWRYQGIHIDNEWAIMVNRQYFVVEMVNKYKKQRMKSIPNIGMIRSSIGFCRTKFQHFEIIMARGGPWKPPLDCIFLGRKHFSGLTNPRSFRMLQDFSCWTPFSIILSTQKIGMHSWATISLCNVMAFFMDVFVGQNLKSFQKSLDLQQKPFKKNYFRDKCTPMVPKKKFHHLFSSLLLPILNLSTISVK